MKRYRLFFVILCTLLTSCSQPPVGDPYFPLQKDLSWTYDITTRYSNNTTERQLTVNSLGRISFNEQTYYVRRTSSGIDYYLNVADDGVYRAGLRTQVELKPRLDAEKRYVLKYPLKVGTNWQQLSQPMVLLNALSNGQLMRDSKVPFSYRIEATDAVITVPAGTFSNCIKVVGEGMTEIFTDAINGFNQIPMLVEEWYAPGVGLIKMQRYELDGETIKIADTPAYYGGHTLLELQSFSQ